MKYEASFQHPDTGCVVGVTYAFGWLRFLIEDCGDAAVEKTEKAIFNTLRTATGYGVSFGKAESNKNFRVKVRTADHATRIASRIGGEQWEGWE